MPFSLPFSFTVTVDENGNFLGNMFSSFLSGTPQILEIDVASPVLTKGLSFPTNLEHT